MTRYDIALGKQPKSILKKTNKSKFSLDDGYRKSGLYKIVKDRDLGFFTITNTGDKLYVINTNEGFWGYDIKDAKKFASKKDAYDFWRKAHEL